MWVMFASPLGLGAGFSVVSLSLPISVLLIALLPPTLEGWATFEICMPTKVVLLDEEALRVGAATFMLETWLTLTTEELDGFDG